METPIKPEGYAVEIKLMGYIKKNGRPATFMDELSHYLGGLTKQEAKRIYNSLSEELDFASKPRT